MTTLPENPAVRRAARILVFVPALAVTSLTGTASAAPPDQWEDNPPVSPLYVLLVLVVIPAGLFVLITLLTYLPSMSRGERYKPGQAWRGEPIWFGGPRAGIDDVEAAPVAAGSGEGGDGAHGEHGDTRVETRGGASGSW